MSAFPQGTLVPVDSAGHMPHADQPDTVVAVVVSFLQKPAIP